MAAKNRLLIERHARLAIRQKTDASAGPQSVDTSDTLRTLCPGPEFLRQARFGHFGQQSTPIKALNARVRARNFFFRLLCPKEEKERSYGVLSGWTALDSLEKCPEK